MSRRVPGPDWQVYDTVPTTLPSARISAVLQLGGLFTLALQEGLNIDHADGNQQNGDQRRGHDQSEKRPQNSLREYRECRR